MQFPETGALFAMQARRLLDRGIVLVSMAIAIALGATSMSDIAVLCAPAPVLGWHLAGLLKSRPNKAWTITKVEPGPPQLGR